MFILDVKIRHLPRNFSKRDSLIKNSHCAIHSISLQGYIKSLNASLTVSLKYLKVLGNFDMSLRHTELTFTLIIAIVLYKNPPHN